VLPSEEDSPGNPPGILALEEEGLGLAIGEAEDLAVTTNVELALHQGHVLAFIYLPFYDIVGAAVVVWRDYLREFTHLARVEPLPAESIVVGTHLGRDAMRLLYSITCRLLSRSRESQASVGGSVGLSRVIAEAPRQSPFG